MPTLSDDFNSARILTQENEYDEALRAYEKILTQHPSHVPSHYNAGQLAAKLGDIKKAHEHFAQVIALEPEFAQGYFQLAQILLIENQPQLAIETLQTAVALQPDYVHAQHLLACTALQQQQYELATQHFVQLLHIAPDHASGHLNFALLKLQQKETEQAKQLLDSAMALDPTLVEAHYHRGVIAMQQGDIEYAILQMQETLDRQADHFAANYNLAILYKMQHHYQLAIHYLKKAQALKPEDESIAFLLAAFSQQAAPEQAPNSFVQELFNHYAQDYDTHMLNTLKYKTPQQLRELFDAQHLSLPSQAVILDLGCGTGLAGEHFKDLNATLIGVDLAQDMLTQAKARQIYAQLHQDDIIHYLQSAAPQSIDLIIAADVFNYFGSLDKVLRACEPVLRDRGLLLFSIELSESDDHVLHSNARYAHSEAYITGVMQHWQLLAKQPCVLRYQENKPVKGEIFLYQS